MVLEYNGYFLFPYFIFEEMEKHRGELLKKSEMNAEDFNLLLNLLLRTVMIVPTEVLFQSVLRNVNSNSIFNH
jgi:predicted nucleic acid-binding protein